MAKITLESLRRTFGDVRAVDGVDHEIADGSFTVLLGPSGCGKTTTLNMIAGLESVTEGRILFDDVEVQDLPPHRRDIAMVFQSYALYPNRTVATNIGFPLRAGRVPRAEVRQRVADVAGRLGLESLLDRYPRELSGGQQQRVALARAIVRTPRAFLLDEPLSNLDAKLRTEMRMELKALQRDIGATFVHVTHDQAEAMSLADEIVVMRDGRIQQAGGPAEIYRRPLNRFVAGFVGTPVMNFVDGELDAGRFTGPGWALPVGEVGHRGSATLGVRSEDAHVSTELGGDGTQGTVRTVEMLGSESLLDVDTEAGRFVARASAYTELQPGARVRLSAQPASVHLFDGESGERLTTPMGAVAQPSASASVLGRASA
jgi:ABC-type sugar transport system ATPase subunit